MKPTQYIKYKCSRCGLEKEMPKGRYESYARKNNTPKYCSPECSRIARKKELVKFECFLCKKAAAHSLVKYKKSKNHFCSKKCSLTWQNTLGPKMQNNKPCPKCGKLIKSTIVHCKDCAREKKKYDLENVVLKDLHYMGTNKYNLVRFHAKKKLKDRVKECQNCKYNIHVEVCHIKAISKFDQNSKLDLVNHFNNLLLLCPNCHYEFDHFDNKRKEILKKCGLGESNPHILEYKPKVLTS